MTQKANDEELASRAASGDAAAFRSLLEAHYDRVFRVAYSVMHSQSDAEDKFTSWLHRVALNGAKDALRRKAAQTRAVEGFTEIDALSRGEAAETNKRLSWLNEALETLSDDLRETAALTLGEEMNFAQAADVLGIAEGTVAWRMSEIRRRLKTLAAKDNGIGKEALA